MKKITTTLLLVILTLTAFAQKVVENPDYGMSSLPGSITKIEVLDTTTILYFNIKFRAGSKFLIPKETFIQDLDGGDKLFIIDAKGVEISKWEIVPESGSLNYALYFPKLNPDVKTIDFGENNSGGNWDIYDIVIAESEADSKIPKKLRGSWLLADGSNTFQYGFYVNKAVVDKEIWKYKSVKNKGKKYEIILEKGDKLKTVFAKLGENGIVNFGSLPKQLKSHSLKRIFNPDFKIENNKPYNESMFQIDSTTYSGVVKDYTTRVGESTGMIYVNNVFSGNQDSYIIKIGDDGSFSVKFLISHPQPILVRLLSSNITVFVEPGKESFQVINGENSFFMGDCAQVNSDLDLMKSIRDNDFMSVRKLIGKTSPEDYKKACLNSEKKLLTELNEIQLKNVISNKALQIKKIDIENNTLEKMAGYGLYRRSVERRNKSAKKDSDKIPFKKFTIDESYYDFVTNESLTNRLSVLTTNYYYLINRLMYASVFKSKTQSSYTTFQIVNLLAKANNKLTDAELAMAEMSKDIQTPEIQKKEAEFRKIHGKTQQELYKKHIKAFQEFLKTNKQKLKHNNFVLNMVDYATSNGSVLNEKELKLVEAIKNMKTEDELYKEKLFRESYGEVKTQFYKKYNTKISELNRNKRYVDVDNNMKAHFGISKSFMFDIIASQRASKKLEDFKVYNDEELKLLQQNINDPIISNYLEVANENTKIAIERNKTKGGYTVNTVNRTEGDELFDAMVKKFKGKVVYVDFWATWCGPCKSGIKRIKPLKEEMKDEDVVFLYITNQTSPEGTWKNAIANIKGEHYRVSKDEWNYLSEKFKITGIPHYTLVDREGEVVKRKLGHRNNDKLKVLLESEMAK